MPSLLSRLRHWRSKPSRSERSLYWRCRRGEPDALVTFSYRVADDLYAMGLAACDDETTAAEAVVEAWERTLQRLGRWRFGGYIERRARRAMLRVLRRVAEPRAARSATRMSAQAFGEGVEAPKLPEAVVARLVERAHAAAPMLQMRAKRRQRQSRIALAVFSFVGATALGLGLAYRIYLSEPSVRAVRVAVVRNRVVAADLANTVRDVGDALPDPEGADRAEAELYGQVVMALEEIANERTAAGAEGLFYVQRRITELDLTAFLVTAAQRQEGSTRSALLQAELALEEVAAL